MGKEALMKTIAFVFVLLWSTAAGAVPAAGVVPKRISFTGRLSTSAGPVNGAVNLTLKLYADVADPTPLWSEDHNNIGADNGLLTPSVRVVDDILIGKGATEDWLLNGRDRPNGVGRNNRCPGEFLPRSMQQN